MAKKEFDVDTKALFEEVQWQISLINGKFLNSKVESRYELIKLRESLRIKSKELKEKYYRKATLFVIRKVETLISKLDNFNIENIKKF